MTSTTAPPQVQPEPEPETERVEGGEMTLLEHLFELRSRITWSAAAVVVGMLPFFVPSIGLRAIDFLLEPAMQQNPDFRAQAISPMENIVTYFRIALLGGIALGMPMLIYQALRFVTPALTPQEKRWVLPVVIGASLSFGLGLVFGYLVVLPTAYGFLFSFGQDFAEIAPTISSYMDLTTRLLLVMGVVFETPIVIMGLAKFGVVSAKKLLGWWRWALVGSFVISAIATPTPDPITQTLVGGPMFFLYMFGIVLAWFVRRE
ncbi:MAG: twin-arginine translocase subunit TatC [Chloroflexi bacterium]|nr:twin-arginine translocase subunit TatC [Chloroflexota bacterium]MDA1146658.1 twin-arginine translocase subunit TatC [Chloroflexota bacterium]MQC82799.1 twin-arginine translocase subunit TatC [Chloroflexota bacterium]